MLFKKKTILLFFFVLCHFSAFMQVSVGLGAGYAGNKLTTDISDLQYSILKNESGLVIEAPIKFKTTRFFFFQAGIEFCQKKYSIRRTGNYNGIFSKYNNSYLSIYFLSGGDFSFKKITIALNVGLGVGYWLSSSISGKEPNILRLQSYTNANGSLIDVFQLEPYSYKYMFIQEEDNRWEITARLGISLTYPTSEKTSMFVTIDYLDARTDMKKHPRIGIASKYNSTFLVKTGIFVRLAK